MSTIHTQTACVEMNGSASAMDQIGGDWGASANPLPSKCPHCSFPDLDHVAEPYLLTNGVASPAETEGASLGNFLVKERVKQLLELTVPGACSFYPTAEFKSRKPTPWWLAVPKRTCSRLQPRTDVPACPVCNQLKTWNLPLIGTLMRMKTYDSGGVDVFKSVEWWSEDHTAEDEYEYQTRRTPELTWQRWFKTWRFRKSFPELQPPTHPGRWTRFYLSRGLYFSRRLELLLRRSKIKSGLIGRDLFDDVKPSEADLAWVEEKFQLLIERGLIEPPKPDAKEAIRTRRWFKQFIKRKAIPTTAPVDGPAIEEANGMRLPQDYMDFISTVGPLAFEDLMEIEGFTARILPPAELDFTNYRRGRVPDLDDEQSQVDGVMFAATEHGDAFVFDVSEKNTDYPVLWHDHEQNTLEPFAANFAGCIKRFAQKN